MADERRIIAQDAGGRFGLDHGAVALYGNEKTPLVHMVCWDEEPCAVEVNGRVVLAGDPQAPVDVQMHHAFDNVHHQAHTLEPVDHTMHVDSALDKPIHHALQMRTPLQVRFCNPWQIASDYRVEVNLGNNRVVSIRLTGATVATPQPCVDEVPCAPTSVTAVHP
jgi:hypothetical protein